MITKRERIMCEYENISAIDCGLEFDIRRSYLEKEIHKNSLIDLTDDLITMLDGYYSALRLFGFYGMDSDTFYATKREAHLSYAIATIILKRIGGRLLSFYLTWVGSKFGGESVKLLVTQIERGTTGSRENNCVAYLIHTFFETEYAKFASRGVTRKYKNLINSIVDDMK